MGFLLFFCLTTSIIQVGIILFGIGELKVSSSHSSVFTRWQLEVYVHLQFEARFDCILVRRARRPVSCISAVYSWATLGRITVTPQEIDILCLHTDLNS